MALQLLFAVVAAIAVALLVLYHVFRQPVPTAKLKYEAFSRLTLGHRGGAAGAIRGRTKLPPSPSPVPVVDGILETVAIPENSMAAFAYAADNGADGIELDTYLSKDGVPVVIHDGIIDGLLKGSGFVNHLTVAQLQSFEFSGVSEEYASERVPTLEEVLIFAKRRGLRVMIEIKEKQRATLMCQLVVALFAKHDLYSLAWAASFNPLSIYKIRQMDPSCAIETCFIYCRSVTRYIVRNHINAKKPLPIFLRFGLGRWLVDLLFEAFSTPLGLQFLGCRMVAMQKDMLTPAVAARNARHGIISGCWVVNARADKARFAQYPINIITDRLHYANPTPKRPLPDSKSF